MYIFWGLLSTIFNVFIEFLLMQIPFSLHRKSMAFFVPMGGIIEGALCAGGVYVYVKLRHMRLKPKHLICGVLYAIIGFWSVYYMNYQTAYVQNGYINNSFKGDRLVTYAKDNYIDFTFSDYLNLSINSVYFKSSIASGTMIDEQKFGNTFNSSVFLSEGAGFAIGGLLMSVVAFRNKGNCKKCRTPYNIKKLYIFKPKRMEDELKDMLISLNSKAEFNAFIKRERERIADSEDYVEVNLKYCSNCHIAYIEYRYMKPVEKVNSPIRWVEDEDRYREFNVEENKYMELV